MALVRSLRARVVLWVSVALVVLFATTGVVLDLAFRNSMDEARHDLLENANETRVTDVALDWGFLHFGWFSQDYRRLFGETPSQTLKRSRRGARLPLGAGTWPAPRVRAFA